MTHQAIVYGPDGKVRYVLDSQGEYEIPDEAALRKLTNAPADHGVLKYKKCREE